MLLEQMRLEGIEAIPAIALTTYAGELNQQKAISAGFAQHLSKPLDPKVLITTISTLSGIAPKSSVKLEGGE